MASIPTTSTAFAPPFASLAPLARPAANPRASPTPTLAGPNPLRAGPSPLRKGRSPIPDPLLGVACTRRPYHTGNHGARPTLLNARARVWATGTPLSAAGEPGCVSERRGADLRMAADPMREPASVNSDKQHDADTSSAHRGKRSGAKRADATENSVAVREKQMPDVATIRRVKRALRRVKPAVRERPSQSEIMKAKWQDPTWRAAMLARRNTPEALAKRADAARRLWKDPSFRARMRAARLGRDAPNKGISPSDITRLRMSYSRRGVRKSEETKLRMSEAKLNRPPNDSWPRLISESKKGKSMEYFRMRREFRALHKDLLLWSDNFRARYGRLPRVDDYANYVHVPMLAMKIKRYLVLRQSGDFALGDRDREVLAVGSSTTSTKHK